MQLLVLGGTAWVGREISTNAVNRGHEVVCLARGSSEVATGARLVRADRDRSDAYAAVTGEHWDAVIDVSRQPGYVRRAAAALQPVADRYLFVSSVSAYASQRELNQDEDAQLLPALEVDVLEDMRHYGEAKVACEQAVTAAFGAGRSLIARPGLIAGPGDTSGRTGYWPWRFAHPSNSAGAVLVPEAPAVSTQVIDARDLAAWLVLSAERGTTGTFNVLGPSIPLAQHLAIARSVAGHSGPLVAAASEWLFANDVQNWSGPRSLPLWIDDVDWHGMAVRDTRRAVAAGLEVRPLEQTLADTLAWELTQSVPHGAGLTDAAEQELISERSING